ncbi:DDE_3 domain-containing protein [Trichonephila clavipes]|nr:DDE_3 domain-containing protein [Trichonephila clavipes]
MFCANCDAHTRRGGATIRKIIYASANSKIHKLLRLPADCRKTLVSFKHARTFFLNGLPRAIFQQDNAFIRIQQELPSRLLRHFQNLRWPSRSDLSPVEHVWDQLKRQMPSCHSVHDLGLAVQDLWPNLPQDNIRCLIISNAGLCSGMYCIWRWSNAPLKLPSICVVAHPVFV